jgi:ABC-type transporter Mla maintaining outer membrane lipid asymmetry permease subunit MlaE
MCAAGRGQMLRRMTTRMAGAVIFGAFVGAWIGRALFKWILDVSGTSLLVLVLATAAAGAVLGVAGALQERRP